MTNSFSIGEAIRFGWHTVKSHSGIVFQVVLTLLALQVASSIVQRVLHDSALGILAGIVLFVVNVFVGAGAIRISLKLARHERAQYNDIWPSTGLVWRYFASGILAGLATFVPIAIGGVLAILTGITTLGNFISFSEGQTPSFGAMGMAGVGALIVIALLTIVAAVYVGLRYSMSRLEVLDGAGIVDSLRKSAIITHGVKWKLLGFLIVLGLLNILGAIVFLVGLLVTIPISMIAVSHVYTKLRAHHHGASQA
ncbi:MAG TPA: hypothetical protein VIY48_14845 [Candidatus Paceibacterota bacterium]